MKINKKITKMLVNENTSLIAALKKIEQGEERICFLVDKKKRLLNTISDVELVNTTISETGHYGFWIKCTVL